jgi:hypothetical protein
MASVAPNYENELQKGITIFYTKFTNIFHFRIQSVVFDGLEIC